MRSFQVFILCLAWAEAANPIRWKAYPGKGYVMDVSGLVTSGSKPVIVWPRFTGGVNDNELFRFDDTEKWIVWDNGKDPTLCVEASGNFNGASIVANMCDSSKSLQKWSLVPTSLGHSIALADGSAGSRCLDVKGHVDKEGQPFQLWDCYFDQVWFAFDISGATPSSPTPSPPTPSPTPPHTPSPTPSGFCKDSACCKANVRWEADGRLCDDFYNANVGIAMQMVGLKKWASVASGATEIFFDQPPIKRLNGDGQQCVSITHSEKTACPYPGDSQYGWALRVGPNENYWKFFQACTAHTPQELCAQCHDGWKCGPDQRTPFNALSKWTYEDFLREKNAVVKQTGTSQCPLSYPQTYNEFDTSGHSASALAGLLIPKCLDTHAIPSHNDVCRALKRSNPARKEPWPVYAYTFSKTSSSLVLQSYLDCQENIVV